MQNPMPESADVQWPERMFGMLRAISSRQDKMQRKIEEIRIMQAEQAQLNVRMDYVEKNLGDVCRRVEGLEVQVRDLSGEIKTLNASYTVRSQYQDRDVADDKAEHKEMKSEAKELRGEIWELVKTWGPWIGLLALFAKDIIQGLT